MFYSKENNLKVSDIGNINCIIHNQKIVTNDHQGYLYNKLRRKTLIKFPFSLAVASRESHNWFSLYG